MYKTRYTYGKESIHMKITVLDRCTVTTGDVSLSPIEALGEVRFFDTLPEEQLAYAISDSDAVICNKANITAQVMDACPNLRYIGLFATGYNNIDTIAASARGITVCNVPGYSTSSVAQHVFALILHFACRADDYAASVAHGDWARCETFSYLAYPTHELSGKTLGIFGFGTIGRAVCSIGQAFGMRVLAVSHRPAEYDSVEFTDTDTLFARSDYLTFHCPLTEETKGIANARTLALMKPSSVLINTARGGLIDEDALAAALNGDRIAGAALDCTVNEPVKPTDAVFRAKNCLITPHIAWGATETRQRLAEEVAENLRCFLEGTPRNKIV